MICRNCILENDTYFLQTVGNFIVINDDYNGVIIMDSDFERIDNISIMEDLCIYNSVVIDENLLLLFCPDNEKFVLVDIKKCNCKIYSIPSNMEDEIIEKKFWNENEELILETYSGNFYKLDLTKFEFSKIEKMIHVEEISQNEKYDDCIKKTFCDDIKGFLYEQYIILLISGNERRIDVKKGFYFLELKIIKDSDGKYRVVTLSANRADQCETMIETIQILK
ncbi:MAG: hypothetical protein K6F39_03755 [Lachnospiraceae bacterium]|nr:hypothetical protein [Lachnospiraceae bacterium]